MPRVRSASLVAALATALALTATGPAAAGPTRAVPEAERLLAAMEQRVAQVAEQLTEGARDYEDGQARLGAAQAAAVAADRAVEQAAATAGDAGAAVREAVRVRYRNPTPAGLQVLLELQTGRLSDALAVRTALARTQEKAEQESGAATVTARESVRARADAEAAREQVAELGREQADRLRRLQDAAAKAEAELSAARERLRRVQQADRRARALEAAAAARAAAARKSTPVRVPGAAPVRVPGAAPVPVPGTGTGTGCASSGPVTAANGLLPDDVLCPLGTAPGHRLVPVAARAYDAMSRAYEAEVGTPLCLTDSYRSYPEQVSVFRRKPGLAAVPGTSNHGWGRAVDLCGGIESFGTAAHRWMQANAPRFGWTHPSWARSGGSRPEPWHWEHAGA